MEEKRIYKIHNLNLSPEEVNEYMRKVVEGMKISTVDVSHLTGSLWMEDIYIPDRSNQ